MRKNNKLLIIISIVFAVVLAVVVFAYLFLATDIFKSKKELFTKYFIQDVEKIKNIINLDTVKAFQNLNEQEKYESNTNVKFIHSEGGEISNPLNNLSLNIDFQKDEAQEYFFVKGQIKDENEICFATELIKDQKQYGIRFPEVFKQFVTIDQDENIKSISDDIGTDENSLEKIINIVEGEAEIFSEEEFKAKKDIIVGEILKGTFEKQKNAMITYNDVTTKTNAYSVVLASEQVRKISEEIFEKTIEDVSSIKVIVYEKSGETIRSVVEIGENKIIMENLQREGETRLKINYSNLSKDEAIECDLEITKINLENQENFEIVANALKGEENYEISVLSKMQKADDIIDLDVEISLEQEITTISLMLENKVKIGSEFERTQSLTKNNYKSLSSIKDETKRKQIVDSIKDVTEKHFSKEVEVLVEKLMLEENGDNEQTGGEPTGKGPSQSEINNFNAKFEFYAGEEVTTENVKVLLDIVKGNCNGYEIKTLETDASIEPTEDTQLVETKKSMVLYIEDGKTHDEAIQKTLEQIEDNKKYKVVITYKETNGLIDYITITEV